MLCALPVSRAMSVRVRLGYSWYTLQWKATNLWNGSVLGGSGKATIRSGIIVRTSVRVTDRVRVDIGVSF